jgi:hypothetical protein
MVPLVLIALACTGCPPPPVVYGPGVMGDLTGIYLGNHSIAFNLTAPVAQPMPVETRQGPVHIYDVSGPAVQVSLRLEQNGEPCNLNGTRQAGINRVVIDPNQRCHIRILYDNNPVLAAMQINQGVVDFSGYNISTDMSGPFVAEALYQGARTSLQGNARISFTGTRQQDR